MNDMDDFVVELGLPLTAHRLRRASDLLLQTTSQWLTEAGPDLPPRTLSTLLLLDETGPQGLTQLARRLRLTHPVLIELTRALTERGLILSRGDPHDGRRNVLEITPAGREAAQVLRLRMKTLDAFYRRLFTDMGADLLDAVKRLEGAAAKRPLIERLRDTALETAPEA
jgi:DNA-binding MarR family transcriptional regulator